ncbi:amyloid protein-binding protein 2-like [Anopheles aquasalis]|uniref:amyloid protein-binding protein 2-like n=1 Tax=Anopheles aquasalis TaxID=42839 RepID=UPI00215A8752|nr:amyloid protein-binding protein 2-like [Anopheles aquasalis]
MISELFNTMHKARFSGIRIVPENSPSLQQSCVRAFVESVLLRAEESEGSRERIAQLQFLPATLLTAILNRMCAYPALRGVLRDELADPVTFMKLFNGYAPDYGTLEKCLREGALCGRPQILKDLANGYCDMLRTTVLPTLRSSDSAAIMARALETLKFGAYLCEAGWCRAAVDVLSLTEELLALLTVQPPSLASAHRSTHRQLTVKCLVQLLRAQIGACLTSKATVTVGKLLSFVDGSAATGDSATLLVKVFLQLGNYYYHVQDLERCHFWALRALATLDAQAETATADSSSATPGVSGGDGDDDGDDDDGANSQLGDVIEVLQLIALFCVAKERHDLGNMLISQAVRRARAHYGSLHRRYADVLQHYGFALLRMNAILPAITAFTECLDIVGRVYGLLSPHAVVLEGYLAHCFYLRSHTTGRFDMALRHADAAIDLARQLMPGSRLVRRQLEATRDLILRGPDRTLVTKESEPSRERDYRPFTLHEIREKFYELDSSFERGEAVLPSPSCGVAC